MASWNPDQNSVQQLISMLEKSQSSDNATQKLVQQRLEDFNGEIPGYNNYLCYILCNPVANVTIRAIAGLLLKNNVKRFYDHINFDYIKSATIQALSDDVNLIRQTAGTVITTIFSRGGLASWPDVLPKLVELSNSSHQQVQEAAFSALLKICEDSAMELDDVATHGKPSAHLIPHFIQHLNSPNPRIRELALNCTNQFMFLRSNSLLQHLDTFMPALYQLANDDSNPVRKQVCSSLTMLLDVKPDVLMPQLQPIVSFMLYCTTMDDEAIALEACEFWLAFAEQENLRDQLEPFLPQVVPVLLKGMVYSEDDIAILTGGMEDDADVPDDEREIKPRHHRAKKHQLDSTEEKAQVTNTEDDDDYDDDDDEEAYAEWNLRKCSAAALDVISTVYSDDLLPILLPLIQTELHSTEWPHRECGILALGAIAEGCHGMEQHLPQIVPFLVSCLSDTKPLVRSITCWTLGRYSRWIVWPPEDQVQQHTKQYFEPVLYGLLKMILDNNKRVQEAGCSAFATFEEEASETLIPHLEPIMETLNRAFGKYQHKNLLILYDAVGTLADVVGNALCQPKLMELLMAPLTQKWHTVADDDRDIFPLLECLSSVAIALGPAFAPFAPPVWDRCLKLVGNTLELDHRFAGGDPTVLEEPDKDFIIVGLDLMSGVCQGLGPAVVPFVQNSNPPLIPLLTMCLKDDVAEVRQSAYALLGDLAIHAFGTLSPHLDHILPELINQIDPNVTHDYVSVCNNAAWALGEMCLQLQGHGKILEPYVPALLQRLIPLLNQQNQSRTLLENAAITIGRMGLVCPQLVAPHLQSFAQPWCQSLRSIRDNSEKETAFLGFCKLIETNPQGIVPSLVYFCDAVTQWTNIPPSLNESFSRILHAFKQMLGNDWNNYFQQYPQQIRQRLHERYQL